MREDTSAYFLDGFYFCAYSLLRCSNNGKKGHPLTQIHILRSLQYLYVNFENGLNLESFVSLHSFEQVLLYDEPTAGLDPIASTVVEDLIRSVHMKGEDAVGKPGNIASYLVVTHQHSTIRRAVDRLCFIIKNFLFFSC